MLMCAAAVLHCGSSYSCGTLLLVLLVHYEAVERRSSRNERPATSLAPYGALGGVWIVALEQRGVCEVHGREFGHRKGHAGCLLM